MKMIQLSAYYITSSPRYADRAKPQSPSLVLHRAQDGGYETQKSRATQNLGERKNIRLDAHVAKTIEDEG